MRHCSRLLLLAGCSLFTASCQLLFPFTSDVQSGEDAGSAADGSVVVASSSGPPASSGGTSSSGATSAVTSAAGSSSSASGPASSSGATSASTGSSSASGATSVPATSQPSPSSSAVASSSAGASGTSTASSVGASSAATSGASSATSAPASSSTGSSSNPTPPDTVLGTTPAVLSNSSFALFSFSCTGAASCTYECALDGGGFNACTSPRALLNLGGGSHTLEVRALAGGLTDPTPASFTWTIDLTGPTTTVNMAPANPTNLAVATFTFSSEAGATFQCSLDGAPAGACNSGSSSYSGLADGTHTFTVTATDTAGNVEAAPPVVTWVVDLTPPVTTITGHPVDPTSQSTASFTFSSQAGSTFQCTLDGGTAAACTSPQAYPGLGAGMHTFTVLARDQAGNVEATAQVFSWTIDLSGPSTTVLGVPPDPTNQTVANFTFTSSKPGSTFSCQLDASAATACNSGTQGYTGLTEGTHTFTVTATDAVGNVELVPPVATWRVDLTRPVTSIVSGPSNGSMTNQTTATFTFACGETGCSYQCTLDGGAPGACNAATSSYTGLGNGSHTFTVLATDAAGNASAAAATRTWTVDTVAPATTLVTGPAAGSLLNVDTATLTFTCNQPPCTFQCTLDTGLPAACDAGTVTYSALGNGPHSVHVSATDAAGNVENPPVTRSFSVDTVFPTTNILSGPGNPSNSTSATFTFSASETGCTFRCSIDGVESVLCTSPQVYTLLAQGPHTFHIVATDAAGNVEATGPTAAWTIDSLAPTANILTQPTNPTASTNATFTFTANEPGCSFRCAVDSAPLAACNSGITYTSVANGTHTFHLEATDPTGNVQGAPTNFTWSVDTVAPVTTINSGPSNATNLTNATFTFSCNEAPCTFQCSVDGGAFSACTSGTMLSGLTGGAHTFRVRGADALSNTETTPAQFSWTVDLTPPLTTLNSQPANPTNALTGSFTFSCNEAPCTFQCSLDGAAFSSCTSGYTTGTLAAGSHNFQVRATDAVGNPEATPVTATWVIDLTAPNATLTAQPTNPSNVSAPAFTFTCNETPCTFQCAVDAGAYVACVSGFTTAALSSTSHTFHVRATDAAGNTQSTPTSYTWTVDTVAPTTTISTGPANPTTATNATFVFSCNEPGCTTQCALDAAAYTSCTTGIMLTGVTNGSHVFHVRATDVLGNVESPAAAYSWTIDLTPPLTTINTAPAASTTALTAAFTFTCNETGCTFQCSLDGAALSACVSGVSYTGLAVGPHTFQVVATDALGNVQLVPTSHAWQVDLTPPDTTITSAPINGAFTSPVTFAFASNEPGSTFQCRFDGGAWSVCASGQSFSVSTTASHRFEVAAIDAAGNVDLSPEQWTFANAWQAASLSKGALHQCAVTTTGTAKCWGPAYVGQLGNGDQNHLLGATPDEVQLGGSTVTQVATGGGVQGNAAAYSCALTSLGGVKCWGSFDNNATPLDVPGLTSGVSAVTVGAGHACALMAVGGGVKCWGSNTRGQLGDNTTTPSPTPVDVLGIAGAASVEAGVSHTCAVVGGDVWCWGAGTSGQLGNGLTADSHVPVSAGLTGVLQVSAGGSHTCARRANDAKCWGGNASGQLGDGTTTDRAIPTDVTGGAAGTRHISAGTWHTCAVTSGDTVRCWGANATGQLGVPLPVNSATPLDVPGLSSVAEVAAGGGEYGDTGFTVVRLLSGGVRMVGENVWGSSGTGTAGITSVARPVVGAAGAVTSVSLGWNHGCAAAGGAAQCWGFNQSGQLGTGDDVRSSTLRTVSGLAAGVTSVAAGFQHSCAVQSGGAWCWGGTALGDGSGNSSPTPVQVSGLSSDVTSVAVGDSHSCALLGSGAIKCWGNNSQGELGNATNTSSNIPVDVTGIASGATFLAVGPSSSCAVVAGAVKCWGQGANGRLGNGTTTSSNVPVQVTGLASGWLEVGVGAAHACARSSSGVVMCWGNNSYGQLGDHSYTQRTVPVTVAELASATHVSAGASSTCGQVAGGRVYCAGDNGYGAFMDGRTYGSAIPSLSRAASTTLLVVGSNRQSCVTSGVGALSCAGYGAYGKLGDGNAWYVAPQGVAGTP